MPYTVFSERLRTIGFKQDSREGAPLCQWTHGALTLDVMPLDSRVLGFSNRWYPDALRTAGNDTHSSIVGAVDDRAPTLIVAYNQRSFEFAAFCQKKGVFYSEKCAAHHYE
ncbi:MAG TPA: hypothetical protein VGI45_27245 [Terracidiphilus sp.]|jgi:hypothetical protein